MKARHVTGMDLTASIQLDDEHKQKIAAAFKPDSDGDWGFSTTYGSHQANLWLWHPAKSKEKERAPHWITMRFEPRKFAKVPKGTPHIGQFIDVIEAMPSIDERDFACNVTFQFGRKLKPKSVFGLPIKVPALMRLPFDTIHGCHVTGNEGKANTYDVVFEAGSGVMVARIMMTHRGKISHALADAVLDHACEICSRFVQTQEGAQGG